MKKITALILSVLVLISSLTCVLITSTSALTPTEIENYFTDPANWKIDDEFATTIEDAAANSWPTKEKTDLTVDGVTNKVIDLHTLNHKASAFLPGLKKNTEYTLSFRYYSTEPGIEGTIFKEMLLFTPDAQNAAMSWNPGNLNGVKHYISYNGGYRWNDDYSDYAWIGENENTTAGKKGEWNTVTFTFNTGTYQNYALVLLSKVEHVYLNNFTLTAEAVPAAEYLKNPSNWILDLESAATVGSTTKSHWAYVDSSTYTADGVTADVLRLHAQNHNASIYLPDIKKNTEYTLSFTYTSNQLGAEQGVSCILKDAILFAPDFPEAKIAWGYSTPNGVKEFMSFNGRYQWNADFTKATTNWDPSVTTATNTADLWYTATFTFNTGAYDNYALILNPDVEWVYIREFSLTEKEVPVNQYFETPSNWLMYKDSARSLSDTDKLGTKVSGAYPDIDNKNTYVKEGDSALYMRNRNYFSAIYLPKGLKANTEYTLSFEYYTPALLDGSTVAFNPISLSTTDLENAGFFFNCPGVLNYTGHNVSYTTTDGLTKQNTKYPAAGENLLTTTAKEWHTVSITFNTANFMEFALVICSKVEYLYLDNFTLTAKEDVKPEPEPEPDPEPTEKEYFETASKWRAESVDSGSGIGNIGSNSANNTNWVQFANSTTLTNGSESSLHVKKAAYQLIDIPLPTLKANTNYKLTFDYYGDTTDAVSFIFERAGIYSPSVGGTAVSVFDFTAKGYLIHIGDGNNSFTSPTGGTEDRVWGNLTLSGAPAKTWNTLTLEFNSGSLTDLVLLLKTNLADLYMDNFSLTEIKPPQTSEDYFEDPANWIIDDYVDKSLEADTTIGFKPSTSRTVSTNTTVTNSSNASLKVNANNGFVSIYLPDELKENTDYYLSFSYYFDAADIKHLGGGANGIFDRYGIYAADAKDACFKWTSPGFITYVSYNGAYSTKDFDSRQWLSQTTAVKEGGKWIDVTIPFNTVTFKKLAFVFQEKVNTFYMDNFAVVEGTPKEKAFHDGPKEQIIVDFEREWDYVSSNSASRMDIAETTDKDGNKTTALHIFEGDYPDSSGVTFLNWQTVDKGSDKVFSIPVKGGQTYEFAVDVNMSAYSKQTDARLLLYADYATSTTLMQMIYYADKDSGVGEGWKTYKFKFTATEDQTVASFGLNAGLKHPEIWIDNITLTESEPDPPFHDGKTDPIKIDFEKEFNYFSGVHVNRMEIAETIGMDGNKTKALHVPEGNFKDGTQVTFVNWAAVIKDEDPVFTIPVKPKTPYKVSMKIKVEKWENEDRSILLLVYHDYNNGKNLIYERYPTFTEQGWVEVTTEFITDVNQTKLSFGMNFGLAHPEIWVDDITYDAYEPGYMNDTDAGYVEKSFNLVLENGYADNGKAEKSVIKMPVNELTKYTFGVTTKGSGKVTLAFDENGKDVIKTVDVTAKNTRHSFNILTSDGCKYVYIILDPAKGGFDYEDLTFFAANSISFNSEIGLTEKDEEAPDKKYEIVFVDADHALGGTLTDDDTADTDTDSPQTGDSGVIFAILLVALTAAGAVLLTTKKAVKSKQ